jgi:hypothetical protein
MSGRILFSRLLTNFPHRDYITKDGRNFGYL